MWGEMNEFARRVGLMGLIVGRIEQSVLKFQERHNNVLTR